MNPGATLFFAQIFILIIVILSSIINISINNTNRVFWTSLLCSSIGYALPSPSWKKKKLNNEEEVEDFELNSPSINNGS